MKSVNEASNDLNDINTVLLTNLYALMSYNTNSKSPLCNRLQLYMGLKESYAAGIH